MAEKDINTDKDIAGILSDELETLQVDFSNQIPIQQTKFICCKRNKLISAAQLNQNKHLRIFSFQTGLIIINSFRRTDIYFLQKPIHDNSLQQQQLMEKNLEIKENAILKKSQEITFLVEQTCFHSSSCGRFLLYSHLNRLTGYKLDNQQRFVKLQEALTKEHVVMITNLLENKFAIITAKDVIGIIELNLKNDEVQIVAGKPLEIQQVNQKPLFIQYEEAVNTIIVILKEHGHSTANNQKKEQMNEKQQNEIEVQLYKMQGNIIKFERRIKVKFLKNQQINSIERLEFVQGQLRILCNKGSCFYEFKSSQDNEMIQVVEMINSQSHEQLMLFQQNKLLNIKGNKILLQKCLQNGKVANQEEITCEQLESVQAIAIQELKHNQFIVFAKKANKAFLNLQNKIQQENEQKLQNEEEKEGDQQKKKSAKEIQKEEKKKKLDKMIAQRENKYEEKLELVVFSLNLMEPKQKLVQLINMSQTRELELKETMRQFNFNDEIFTMLKWENSQQKDRDIQEYLLKIQNDQYLKSEFQRLCQQNKLTAKSFWNIIQQLLKFSANKLELYSKKSKKLSQEKNIMVQQEDYNQNDNTSSPKVQNQNYQEEAFLEFCELNYQIRKFECCVLNISDNSKYEIEEKNNQQEDNKQLILQGNHDKKINFKKIKQEIFDKGIFELIFDSVRNQREEILLNLISNFKVDIISNQLSLLHQLDQFQNRGLLLNSSLITFLFPPNNEQVIWGESSLSQELWDNEAEFTNDKALSLYYFSSQLGLKETKLKSILKSRQQDFLSKFYVFQQDPNQFQQLREKIKSDKTYLALAEFFGEFRCDPEAALRVLEIANLRGYEESKLLKKCKQTLQLFQILQVENDNLELQYNQFKILNSLEKFSLIIEANIENLQQVLLVDLKEVYNSDIKLAKKIKAYFQLKRCTPRNFIRIFNVFFNSNYQVQKVFFGKEIDFFQHFFIYIYNNFYFEHSEQLRELVKYYFDAIEGGSFADQQENYQQAEKLKLISQLSALLFNFEINQQIKYFNQFTDQQPNEISKKEARDLCVKLTDNYFLNRQIIFQLIVRILLTKEKEKQAFYWKT